ncbi:MAG: hypothetical protein HKO95_04930 [Rhodobacteraceae bacterium]|nr:hypothetical protein [Paracoccaceae bacterium]
MGERVKLSPFNSEVTEDHLPAARFFSNSHTTDYGIEELADGEETLFVDGEWEIPEFGDFYKKYSDIYVYLMSLKRRDDAQASGTERRSIIDAFLTKPFKGGSSYLSLFNDLKASLPYSLRPGLEKMEYASPGEMDIRGDADVFSGIEDLVKNFLVSSSEIETLHKELRDYLSESGLLAIRAGDRELSVEQARFVQEKCRELDATMGVDKFEALIDITGGNILVVSKITLAVYRRLSVASSYFAEGRVSYEAH